MPFDEEELDPHGECAAKIGRLNDLLRGVGANRYWEGRWRDEKAENERLREALLQIKLKGLTTGYGKTALSRIAHEAINAVAVSSSARDTQEKP